MSLRMRGLTIFRRKFWAPHKLGVEAGLNERHRPANEWNRRCWVGRLLDRDAVSAFSGAVLEGLNGCPHLFPECAA
ncbi:MAG: hypothetical protein JWO19_5291 [Bryobacterales bacterium]|nr:hypothetical protein [Bryobacterales bacterium]